MKANQQQREELFQLIAIANAERDRRDRVEDLIGNVLFSVLGACVAYTIVLWATC